jgi:hypothetical protein
MLGPEQFREGYTSNLGTRYGVRRKDRCWSVKLVYDPREL